MWFVVTFGSPRALNIATLVSRVRSRVCRAAMPWRRASGAELAYQIDVLLHRFVGLHALELRPGFVLGRADEIEETGLRAGYVAFVALLVQRIQLQQRGVVGAFAEFLDVLGGLLELRFQIGHDVPR